ncbi:MAG: hypothetical protein EBU90_05185 [Proteobacteria bacterium]|jgi:CO dehydrogenase/acetyl-CoA synthase delta subunit|nr:hypothetical protein [Pseudomonadota bacterium]NBP14972.1 hypothetical protein [bacterium]
MKQLLSIALLAGLCTATNQLEAKNYKVKEINPELKKMTINMGDTFSYETQAVAPYTGQILDVKLSATFFDKETRKAEMLGGATTHIFTAKKSPAKFTKMTITRREQPQQAINIIIQK